MPSVKLPASRPLKIFAIDPEFGRRLGNHVSVDLDYEPLTPGPVGERLAVVDYDGGNDLFYAPVDLEDRAILMQGGLEPSEADPWFHQQMVYAVASRTLSLFDYALGRRINLWKSSSHAKLRLFPHAFVGANAFYDPQLHALLFGYFRADADDPGANLPGQLVFTCLSHDIVAHEMTHAMIHKLRPHFLEPTHEDILAFHEGFADLIALFQHFTYPETLTAELGRVRADLNAPSLLSDVAVQFGQATGTGAALRSALSNPDRKLSDAISEPHTRGGVLVAAVYDAFKSVYAQKSRVLIGLATGGSGILPAGALSSDLIAQLADTAARLARTFLTMLIRAFDYMPPMDMTFGDFLRALVTADINIYEEDSSGIRATLIEAFRARAIYPQGILSLAEESLSYPVVDDPAMTFDLDEDVLAWFNFETIHNGLTIAEKRSASANPKWGDTYKDLQKKAAVTFHALAQKNAAVFGLDPDPKIKIHVTGFHRVSRISPKGQVLHEIVLGFEQEVESNVDLGGLPLRGGSTVIATADGRIRYIISKPLPATTAKKADHDPGTARVARISHYVKLCDQRDPRNTYRAPRADRMLAAANLRSLHEEQI